MTQFKTQQERDAAARALISHNQQQVQPNPSQQPSWSNWFSNRFTAENALNIPYNAYAHASNAIGAGINGARYFLDPQTAPHPTQRQTDPAASRAAFDAAGLAATGGIAGATAARATGGQIVPPNSVGAFGSGKASPQSGMSGGHNPIRAWHGTPYEFSKFDANKTEIGPHFGSKAAAEHALEGQLSSMSNLRGVRKRMIQADLDIKNPLRLDDMDYWDPEIVASDAQIMGLKFNDIEIDVMNKYADLLYGGASEAAVKKAYQKASEHLRRAIERNGYDGIVYKNTVEDIGSDSYIAIKKGTVKDARTGETLFSSGIPGLHATEEDY